MKFELKCQYQIESARFLPHLADGHPCKSMHGHSFQIAVKLHGDQLPKEGWVRDYHEIDTLVKGLLGRLDHRILNEVQGLENPTSENLCAWIFHSLKPALPELVQVSVRETTNTECSYPIL